MRPSRKYAFYALGIIFFANFLNYLDRMLVSALEKPVTQALGLTGTEFGLLWTLFTVGYIASAPFVGFLTDRYRRAHVFAACIFVWSLATIASGMAQVKLVLYVSRFFIGVGEAGCLIIGPALITDIFDRRVRGRVLSLFYLGLPLGGTSGYLLGGVFDKFFDWRSAFLAAGLPGLAVAVILFLLREPPRGAVEGEREEPKIKGIKPYLELFKTRTLMYIIFAEAFAVMILVPLLHFGKGFFQESRGLDPFEASLSLGVLALVGGVLGNLTSGWLGDKLSRRRPGAYALIAGFAYLLGMPFIIVSFFVGPGWLFLTLLIVGCTFYFMCMPAVNTQIANVTHPSQRAMAYALAVFALHFLGDMLTPPIFGTVSDTLTRRYDPVTVTRVRLHSPEGPFRLQYKSYKAEEASPASAANESERWVDAPVRVTNAERLADGFYRATKTPVDFELDPIATTRMRYLRTDAPGALSELEVYDSRGRLRPVRADASSDRRAAVRIIDGDPDTTWTGRTDDARSEASSIFGFPGKGRRTAFISFSFFMILAGVVCFLAYRHAARDAARVASTN